MPAEAQNSSAMNSVQSSRSGQSSPDDLRSKSLEPVQDSSPLAFFWLILGLLALSSTAIFIKLSIREISAEATVFNRLWIATLAFTSWNLVTLGQSKSQDSQQDLAQDPAQDPAQDSGEFPTNVSLANALPTDPDSVESSDASDPSDPTVSTLQIQTMHSGYAGLRQSVESWSWETIGLLLALGLVHLTGRYLWTWSLTSTTAANGAMLANMPPLFTALGGWLFLGQRFDRRFLSGLAIAVIGSVTLVIGDWIQPKEALFGTGALLGDGAALLSSVFYAASFLLVEKLRQRLSTSDILVWRCALGLVIATPLVWAIDNTIFPISAMGWIAVLGLALVSEVMGHGLIVYSLKHFSSAFVTIVLLLEPAPVAAVAWIWFGEFLDPLNIAGFCLITLGIYFAKTGTGSTGGGGNHSKLSNQEVLELELTEISGES
jgi:drug/metabolite transporter (DMT)-like permease